MSLQELLPLLTSNTTPSASALHTPQTLGFVNVPEAEGVAVNLMSNLPVPELTMTEAPLATHVRLLFEIKQSMFPLFVIFVTLARLAAPYLMSEFGKESMKIV